MESYAEPRVAPGEHIRGRADAPVTVIEYGDYECPLCRGAARDVHRLLDSEPDLIRFVFRNFPIPQLHPKAEQAAEAAEAAGAQGRFWEMYELLLGTASHLDLDSLIKYARQIGLDVELFERNLYDRAYASKIEQDMQEGIRNGVNATPKFYVNGMRIDGKLPLEGLFSTVHSQVAAARSPGGIPTSWPPALA